MMYNRDVVGAIGHTPLIELRAASAAELREVPGIGPKLAVELKEFLAKK